MLSSLYLTVRWLQFVTCSFDGGRFIVFIELYRVLLSLIDRLGDLGCPHQLKRRRPSISFLQATGASQAEVAYEWFNVTGASPSEIVIGIQCQPGKIPPKRCGRTHSDRSGPQKL
jgi:hypothetical protein